MELVFGEPGAVYLYNNGVPVRYYFYGRSDTELMRFFSALDAGGSSVLEERLAEDAGDGVSLSVEVQNPNCLLVTVRDPAGTSWEIRDFGLESQTDSGWEAFVSDSGWSEEPAGDDLSATLFYMDSLPMGRHRVLVKVRSEDASGEQKERLLRQEFEIIGQSNIPCSVPLEYLPQPLRLSDRAVDDCLVVGGTTVLANQVIWDTCLAEAQDTGTAFPIRIVLSRSGQEDSFADQVIDVVLTDSCYHVYELQDGKQTETIYTELHRVELAAADGSSGYAYILTNDPEPPADLNGKGQLLFRQMYAG